MYFKAFCKEKNAFLIKTLFFHKNDVSFSKILFPPKVFMETCPGPAPNVPCPIPGPDVPVLVPMSHVPVPVPVPVPVLVPMSHVNALFARTKITKSSGVQELSDKEKLKGKIILVLAVKS